MVMGPNGSLSPHPSVCTGGHNAISGRGPAIPLTHNPALTNMGEITRATVELLCTKQGKVVRNDINIKQHFPPAVQVQFEDVVDPVWVPAACLCLVDEPEWSQLEG